MGIIGVMFFLAIGVGLAWLFDVFVLQRSKKSIQIGGYDLVQSLKRSGKYEAIRRNQEIPSGRSRHRIDHHSRNVGELGDGGDGGQVLQLDPRRKM